MMRKIAAMCAQLKNGSYVITFSSALSAPHLKILSSKEYKQSWGRATVYTHVKTDPDPLWTPRKRDRNDDSDDD